MSVREKGLDKNLDSAILFALRTNTGKTIRTNFRTAGTFLGGPKVTQGTTVDIQNLRRSRCKQRHLLVNGNVGAK